MGDNVATLTPAEDPGMPAHKATVRAQVDPVGIGMDLDLRIQLLDPPLDIVVKGGIDATVVGERRRCA